MDNSRILACGVVGAGVFGGFHAAKYAAHPRTRLIGVYDRNPERAAALAARHDGARAFDRLEDLLAECEAVSICSPAVAHAEQASAALAASRHVLVEKPLASGAASALALVQAAERGRLQLHAGHQERFAARAAGLFAAPPPRRLMARRYSPPQERGTDVSVVMDLMVHDIDLVLRLQRATPAILKVEGDADTMAAHLGFPNGSDAILAAGRRAGETIRDANVEWEGGGAVLIDWAARTLNANTDSYPFDPAFGAHPDAKDPLAANIAAFIASVLDGAPAMAPGREAAAAVAVAEMIEYAAGLR